jgi:DNA-binding NtrC family response regulator
MQAMTSILVVDDQKAQRKNLAFYLKSQGYNVDTAESGEEALGKIESIQYDLVISDFKMEKISGLELMIQGRNFRPSTEFIIVTGFASIPLAVDFIREGAADFISKPFEYSTILDAIHKIEKRHQVKHVDEENALQIICQSQKMKDIAELALKAAASDVTVLIEGEIGTGRELFARIVHNQSSRSRNPMQIIDCSEVEQELEQAIFGTANTNGALTIANGGTLLLRDIERLSPKLQARLVRFLREGIFAPVDSAQIKKTDTRIMAATTKNLKQQVQAGAFREDLYYLLIVMPVYMPPLRIREGDILPLIKHFLAKYKAINHKEIKAVSPEVISWMTSYEWPGNVREMENIIARACVLASGDILDESLIFTLPQDRPADKTEDIGLNITLKDNQRTLILKALKQNENNYSRTAAQLGISRTTLWRRIKRFRIEGLPVESC